jgi:hypothetical protein
VVFANFARLLLPSAQRRWWHWLAVGLVSLYVVSAVLLVLFEEGLLRWHARGGEVFGSGTDVWLQTEDGVRLHARYYHKGPDLPVLLYLHGGAGNLATRSDRLELFADLGANLLALEYRGYGRSDGTSSERGLERDAIAGYAWLRKRTGASQIVPFGESLGGGLATWLAVSRPVGALILLSTATNTPALAAHYLPWLPTSLLVRTRFDNLGRIRRVRAPKLFIHSRVDEVVPFDMAIALWRVAHEPKRHLWLDRVGHNQTFYAARHEALTAIRQFLASLHVTRREPM